MNDFSKSTLRKLAKKGVTLVGLQAVPGFEGDAYFTGTAYRVSDNGTHRVLTFGEVLELAG